MDYPVITDAMSMWLIMAVGAYMIQGYFIRK